MDANPLRFVLIEAKRLGFALADVSDAFKLSTSTNDDL